MTKRKSPTDATMRNVRTAAQRATLMRARIQRLEAGRKVDRRAGDALADTMLMLEKRMAVLETQVRTLSAVAATNVTRHRGGDEQ